MFLGVKFGAGLGPSRVARCRVSLSQIIEDQERDWRPQADLSPRSGVERTLLSAAFDFGVAFEVSTKSEQIKVKSGGQECPPHTAFDFGVVLEVSIKSEQIKVKSGGQECPPHTAFDFGVAFEVSTKPKQIKVKSGGQECPPHINCLSARFVPESCAAGSFGFPFPAIKPAPWSPPRSRRETQCAGRQR
jgi:hypothetical protein